MATHCCKPLCNWYVSLTDGRGCPPRCEDNNGCCLTCCTDLTCSICCCTCTYCFCGETPEDRYIYCIVILETIDECFENIFCCIRNCVKEKRQHEIELAKISKITEIVKISEEVMSRK